jgi:glucose/arabinose dehydrogenase
MKAHLLLVGLVLIGCTDQVGPPVVPGAKPARLAFTALPDSVPAGNPFTPSVAVSALDSLGHLVTTFKDTVTLSLATNAGSGTLSGTLKVAAFGGVAYYTNLQIDSGGNGYRLAAAASGIPTDTSGSFVVFKATLALHLIAGSLSEPVYVTASPGDTSRIFIVEQTGTIRVVLHDSLLATPFLDVGSRISVADERGLLSVAFDPGYASNGRFFVYYTDTLGNIQIVRFNVSGDPNVANLASASPVLSIAHSTYDNHNGGLLIFGADGYLYAGVGDGGGSGNPLLTGQDSTQLLGKILRIDVSGASGYTIPASNPFASKPPAAPEVWAYGMRNPWRFSFDRTTHDLFIGDVGQDLYEEIDHQAASSTGGENYGWNTMEGLHCYSPSTGCNQTGLVLPVLEYAHGPGCAVIGGYVYRGTDVPQLSGRYVYGDLCGGFIKTFTWSSGVTAQQDLTTQLGSHVNMSSFGEDARGELYLVVHDGQVYRFESAP